MCDCSCKNKKLKSAKPIKSNLYALKVIAETLYPYPVTFSVLNVADNQQFKLTADEIIRLGYIYNFSPKDVFSIAYCYAEQQFINY